MDDNFKDWETGRLGLPWSKAQTHPGSTGDPLDDRTPTKLSSPSRGLQIHRKWRKNSAKPSKLLRRTCQSSRHRITENHWHHVAQVVAVIRFILFHQSFICFVHCTTVPQGLCQPAIKTSHLLQLFEDMDVDIDMEDGLTLTMCLEAGMLDHVEKADRGCIKTMICQCTPIPWQTYFSLKSLLNSFWVRLMLSALLPKSSMA